MSLVVVGGNTRNIGKTSVVAGIIAAMPSLHWTAIKITQFGHGVCSANGEPCDCVTADHTIAVSEERNLTSGTDSSRYLAAGAAHSFWVRTRQGQLHEAMPRVRQILANAENAIIESNSVLRFLKPDLALSVLDLSIDDFKPSALRYLDRIDAVIFSAHDAVETEAVNTAKRLIKAKPSFLVNPPNYMNHEVVHFVSARLQLPGA